MNMEPKQNQYHGQAKKSEEDHPDTNPLNNKFPKITSSRQWSSYKNPRIVRVSRAFGGKDRHSKVCTVKGLRDRRIRLSAPTAIQLYDLQDRLGLSQPSKVVDWLLEATKEEIDKLPPLPMIPHQFYQPNDPLLQSNMNQSSLYKDLLIDHTVKSSKENQDQGFGGFVSQNLFPLSNYQQGLAHYNVQSWDHCTAPNLTLSQFGGGFSLSSSQSMDDHHLTTPNLNMANAVMIPSFPSYNIIPSSAENSTVMPTTLHLISNSPMKSSFGLNVNYRSVDSHGNDSEKA